MTATVMDQSAGYKLIATGALVEFEVVESKVTPSAEEGNVNVRMELQLGGPGGEEAEGGDGEEQAEWGAFGFMFALAVLSFADARPRGYSDQDFVEKDDFTVADFFDGLSFAQGALDFHADYIRGRCVKTWIRVDRYGRVRLETTNRGEAALRWVERLKGRKHLQEVP